MIVSDKSVCLSPTSDEGFARIVTKAEMPSNLGDMDKPSRSVQIVTKKVAKQENAMKTESEALMDTLMFTLGVIVNNGGEKRVRIANAYAEAQELVASIKISNGDARPRIVACFEPFDAYKAADDVAAAGWMLTALQQRIGERNLQDWEKLAVVADKAVEMLPGTKVALGKGLRQL